MDQKRRLKNCSAQALMWLCTLMMLTPGSCFQPCSSVSFRNFRRGCDAQNQITSSFSGGRPNALDILHLPRTSAKKRRANTLMTGPLMMSATSTAAGIRSFFGASSISSVMNAANNVPPVYYFVYLLAAGVGVPVSEDVMVIFVGTLLGSAEFSTKHKAACVAWCYMGVVISDMLTYGIGAGFRKGLFNPLRRILFKDLGQEVDDSAGASAPTLAADGEVSASGNAELILDRIRRSGKFVGIAERFAVGARGPMTLLCGFTGVSFRGFAAGVAVGALFGTIPIQLALGYALRDRPAAMGAIGAAFLSFYTLGPPIMAAVGGATLWVGRRRKGKKGSSKKTQAPGTEGALEFGGDGAGI